jgi:hypothetical protein
MRLGEVSHRVTRLSHTKEHRPKITEANVRIPALAAVFGVLKSLRNVDLAAVY